MALPFTSHGRNDEGISLAVPILKQRFGERCATGQAIRDQHGHTTTFIPTEAPDAVVFVKSTDEVKAIVEVCKAHRVPIIAFGVGTSLEGHVNAPAGGICIDFGQMNEIVSVEPEDLTCTVQPGVTRKQINEHLRDSGLFFPIDPGADATIGGMSATRASGTNAVRYGTMRDNVIRLKAVMANGEVITTASRAKKTSAGYDLTRLLIGSEGTLGLITEITLKLYGIPEAILAAVCPFPTVEAACNTTIMTIQSGIPVARIELLDALQVKSVNAYSKLDLPEQPTLFLEFHGTEGGAREQAELVGEIAADLGGGPFRYSERPEERNKLWQARHDVYFATFGLKPGATAIATDVCVPISRLAECVEATRADLAELDLFGPIVGHVGDGNFHCSVLVSNDEEIARARKFTERLALRAVEMEGTCTGEHGIGQGKMPYLRRELGGAVDVMRQIKTALDPDGILNPGKIFP